MAATLIVGSPPMPRSRQGLVVHRFPDETLVYDPRDRVAHRLDRLATLVFEACDGVTPRLEVVERLVSAGAVPELLEEILDLLVERKLIAPVGSGASRRQILAGGARLAAALPFITSLAAPGPAAAVSLAPGTGGVEIADGNTEGYDHQDENPFREVLIQPSSTFGADVDTASYSNVRRFLDSGELPPPEAVRIEEMLNYFRYDDPEPGPEAPLELRAELSECPWESRHQLLRLGLQTPRIELADLPPRNLVFLLDVSGSMDSPDKLPLVKASLRRLVDTLGAQDQVSIVVYAGAAGVVLEPTAGDRADAILAALARLEAGGSTFGSGGLELAYRLVASRYRPGGINRVILATDGDFNVGTTSRGGLIRLIEERRDAGIDLSVLGFGTGNLKDGTMEQLADHGNGNFAYLDSLAEARRVLVAEAGATLYTVARDVKLQIEWNPAQVYAYRLLGYENRLLAREHFADDAKDGGELGAGHHLTVLYELIPAGDQPPSELVEPLRYQTAPRLTDAAASGELALLLVRWKGPEGGPSRQLTWTLDRGRIATPAAAVSEDFRLASGVATFGLLLRSSRYRGAASYRLAGELVASTVGGDREGYRGELVRLIGAAADLAGEPA